MIQQSCSSHVGWGYPYQGERLMATWNPWPALGVAQSASQEARQRASRMLARTYSESHARACDRPVALFERV